MTERFDEAVVGFDKSYESGLDLEVEKATAVHAVGITHGFASPAVLNVDRRTRTVTYDRYDDLISLRERYLDFMGARRRSDDVIRPFAESGRALAAIHADLTLSRATPWTPPPGFGSDDLEHFLIEIRDTPQAWLHGDYGFGNTHTSRGDAMDLVVLDPSPNRYLTLVPDTYGSTYLDIGLFLACIQGLVPARFYPRLYWGRERVLRDAFLASYQEFSGEPLQMGLLERVTYEIASAYCRHRFGGGLRASLAMQALYKRPRAAWQA